MTGRWEWNLLHDVHDLKAALRPGPKAEPSGGRRLQTYKVVCLGVDSWRMAPVLCSEGHIRVYTGYSLTLYDMPERWGSRVAGQIAKEAS